MSELSPLEKVAFVRIKVPFIKDRCAFVRGVGFDRIASSNTICIFAEGITNKDLLAKEHIDFAKAIAGCELLDLKHITLELKYKGAEVC